MGRPPRPEETKTICLEIKVSTHRVFKSLCGAVGRSQAAVVTELVESWVAEHRPRILDILDANDRDK